MEEMNTSYVYQSLVRTTVTGNVPSKWFMFNVLIWTFIGFYIFIAINLVTALFCILGAVITNILLQKSFALDEKLFSIYIRHLFMPDYISSSTRISLMKDSNNKF